MRWNQQKIHDSLCHKGLQWNFNPLSPSSGGAWEVLVKAVKKILRFLLRDRFLDEESLHTFMVEVEWILNNRPLTPVNDSPDDLAALTATQINSISVTEPTQWWADISRGWLTSALIRQCIDSQ